MRYASILKYVAVAFGLWMCADVRAEVVAYWNFNEAADATSAADATGTYNATPSEGVTFGAAGQHGNAATFAGTARNQLSFDQLQGIYDTDLSFAFWVNPTALTNGAQFIGAWQKNWAFRVFLNGNKVATDLRQPTNGNFFNGTTNSALAANTWTHVAVVWDRDAKTLKTYLNGKLDSTLTSTVDPTTLLKTSDGQYGMGFKQDDGAGTAVLAGALDDMYVMNNALTEQQIRGLAYSNNINKFVVAKPYEQTENKILLGALFGAAKGSNVQDAMATGGTYNKLAAATDLGVAQLLVNQETLAGNQDLNGNGMIFNMDSIGAGNCYPAGGVKNAAMHDIPISATGTYYDSALFNVVGKNFKMDEGIGIHANGAITFDLDELRTQSGWGDDARLAFVCSKAGLNDTSSTEVDEIILISDAQNNVLGSYVNGKAMDVTLTDGVYSFTGTRPAALSNTNRLYDVSMALPSNAKYLTLAATQANGNITADHAIFAQAHLLRMTTEEVKLNRFFDDTGSLSTTGGRNLDGCMSTNTIGATAEATDSCVSFVSGDLTAPMSLAEGVTWKIDFNKNFAITAARNHVLRNSLCAEGNDYNTQAINPALGTVDAPNDFIGMHAEAVLTYDLGEIRLSGGWDPNQRFHFTTTATGAHASGGALNAAVLLSNDDGLLGGYVNGEYFEAKFEDGAWFLDMAELPGGFSGTGSVDFEADLMENVKYLSLAMLSNGDKSNDHGAFLDPTLILLATEPSQVPEPATWVLLLSGLLVAGSVRTGKRSR